MKENILQSLGLKTADLQVYQALLESGPSSIRQVALVTKINRGTTYEILKRLVGLGLVSFNRQGERRKFVAESPEALNELAAEKQRELNRAEEAVKELIPNLMALGERRLGEPIVRFFEDDEGIVAILRDVLNTVGKQKEKEYWVYSSRPMRQYIYRKFPNFSQRRIKEGVFVKVIAVGEGGEPVECSERKWLPETRDQLTSYTIIYGNKVALISVSPDDTPYGVIVEEPGVAAMQKYLFETLWASLP